MTIYTMPNLSSGIDEAIVGTVGQISSFTPMLLLFVFGVIFIGGMVSQKRRVGSIDIPMWATVSSIGTLLVALILTLREGLIQIEVLTIVVVITIFSGFWLFFDKRSNEA